MYFIVNEGMRDNRYRPSANIAFFASMQALTRDTEPQDFQFGDLHITDSEGFEYDVEYIANPNSVKISRGRKAYPFVEDMVRGAFAKEKLSFIDGASITENIENLVNDGKLLVSE